VITNGHEQRALARARVPRPGVNFATTSAKHAKEESSIGFWIFPIIKFSTGIRHWTSWSDIARVHLEALFVERIHMVVLDPVPCDVVLA